LLGIYIVLLLSIVFFRARLYVMTFRKR